MNSIDFGGHRSNMKVRMGIIDKYGVHEDATLCVVLFQVNMIEKFANWCHTKCKIDSLLTL